jgi:hypothetical protein
LGKGDLVFGDVAPWVLMDAKATFQSVVVKGFMVVGAAKL